MHRKAMTRRRAAVVCLLLALAFPAGAADTPLQLKLSVVVAPLYPMGAVAKAWGDALNASSQGALEVKLYPGAVLAKRDASEEFNGLAAGTIDMAVGSALQWCDAFPPLAVFAMPWMIPGNAQLQAVVSDRDVVSRIAAALDAAGVTLVAMAPLRHRDLATQARAIGSPDDLVGLRVRVPASRLVSDTYVALGAAPTGLGLEDARNAFAAGLLDGQDQSAAALVAARAWATGARYVVQWGAFASVTVLAVNKALWQQWPESTRAMVRAAAGKAIASVDTLAREHAAHDELARNGIAITRLTAAGRAAFRARVDSVYAGWTPKIGVELFAAVKAAAERAGDTSGTKAGDSPQQKASAAQSADPDRAPGQVPAAPRDRP
jgi:TRAP-type transport system periplasmic protein